MCFQTFVFFLFIPFFLGGGGGRGSVRGMESRPRILPLRPLKQRALCPKATHTLSLIKIRVFTNPSLSALGREKRFRDNRVLKTASFETVISRSILCNLGKKIRHYESTDSLLSDGINLNII